MTIWRMLTSNELGPEEKQILDLAYRQSLKKLGLIDGGDDPLCEVVAHKIIEVNARGVRNVVAISEIAVRELKSASALARLEPE